MRGFDRYAIAATKLLPTTIQPSVVRRLPPEFSRFTRCLIINEWRVSCNITDAHNQWSPLVPTGLEISDGCCGAGKEQRTGHWWMSTRKRLNGLLDDVDVLTSALKILVSYVSESDVEGHWKWLFEGCRCSWKLFFYLLVSCKQLKYGRVLN